MRDHGSDEHDDRVQNPVCGKSNPGKACPKKEDQPKHTLQIHQAGEDSHKAAVGFGEDTFIDVASHEPNDTVHTDHQDQPGDHPMERAKKPKQVSFPLNVNEYSALSTQAAGQNQQTSDHQQDRAGHREQ